jgi:nitronate monooxygenase
MKLLGTQHPIVLAPMAGAADADLAIAVAEAGGLGSIPCAALTPAQIRAQVTAFRDATRAPLNVNFFAHRLPPNDPDRGRRWRERVAKYYAEVGVERADAPGATRAPFDDVTCALVEELRPAIVSFHFGLPDPPLLERVKKSGAKILSSATTVREAIWLQDHGADAVIAQGLEAGGHRGMFLGDDVATQIGLFALLPQIVDAVSVPIIAAGGIADPRGVRAAFALGASAVQVGTAYLLCPEAKIANAHREALLASTDESTVVTNVLTGRPARGIANRIVRELGPIDSEAPAFPLAAIETGPLRTSGNVDVLPLWSGQAAGLVRASMSAQDLTRELAKGLTGSSSP